MRYQALSKKTIQNIRHELLAGKTEQEIANERWLPVSIISDLSWDFSSPKRGEPYIGGKTFYLLKQLLTDGYVFPESNTYILHILRKYFPIIKRVQINGKTIYFLSDRNKIALQAMINEKKSRVISFHDLSQMSKLFGISLSSNEKSKLIKK